MKISDCVTTIVATHAAHTPLYMWGPPGIGKTALVHAAAELLGVELTVCRTNLFEPVDFLGFPKPLEERVVWLAPEMLPREGTRGILFLDEFAQAPIATQCAAMRLVDHLPSGWQVVCASNRATDRAGAGQVATHVLSRFSHVEVDVTREDWQRWALTNDIRPEVRAFIDFRPSLLFVFDGADMQRERANCSPRAWHRASRILTAFDAHPEPLLHEVLSGTVGVGPAAEFIAFCRLFRECPSADTIIANPDTAPVPTEPSARYAVCAALADRAKTASNPHLGRIIEYATRLPTEFGALLITDVVALNRAAITFPATGKWIKDHQLILASARA